MNQTNAKKKGWTGLEQSRTNDKRSDPTQQGLYETKPEQNLPGGHRREKTGAVQTKANRTEQTNKNTPNQTEENSLDKSKPN